MADQDGAHHQEAFHERDKQEELEQIKAEQQEVSARAPVGAFAGHQPIGAHAYTAGALYERSVFNRDSLLERNPPDDPIRDFWTAISNFVAGNVVSIVLFV